MQREYTGVYPGSGKEDPTSSGGESVVFPCTGAFVGVTSCEKGSGSQVSRKEKMESCLRC
jgi:hypothetical protein